MSLGIEPPETRGATPASLMFLLPAILTQMTTAAVWEEPLFRGFLWGYLRRWRWPNVLIWLFQAALFTAGHIYYLKEEAFVPWLIRMMLPSLIVGLIAWQARSIFASMVTHGVFNASGDMLSHTRSLPEAIQVSWSAVVILAGIFVVVWILEWLRHRRAGAIC
jgi:membrane protease YdiL (CAAX protease family)